MFSLLTVNITGMTKSDGQHMRSESPDDVMDITEAAALLRCSERTIRRMVASGKLAARRLGESDRGELRFSRKRLQEWVDSAEGGDS